MTSFRFLELPKTLLSLILKEFLDIKDFSNVGIAIQSTEAEKDTYFRCLESIRLRPIALLEVIHVSNGLYNWLTKHHVHLSPKKIVVLSSYRSCAGNEQQPSAILIGSNCFMTMMSEIKEKKWFVANVTTIIIRKEKSKSNYLEDAVFILLMKTISGAQLTHLDISGCTKLSNDSILLMSSLCFSLKALNISNLRKLTRTAVEAIVHNQTNLTSINMERSVHPVFDPLLAGNIRCMFQSCKLVEVNIRHCGCLFLSTIDFVARSASNCNNMRKLVLNNSCMAPVGDSHISDLCGFCPLLQEMTLDNLYCVTVRAFICLGRFLKNLTFLSFNGLNDCDLIVQVLSEVFAFCSSVDLCEMRVSGHRRRTFHSVSTVLERLIRKREDKRNLGTLPHSDWREFSMTGFREPMLDSFCSQLLILTIGNWSTSQSSKPTPGELASACQNLTELNIVMSNIDDQGVEAFVQSSNKRLTILRLESCEWVGDRGLSALVSANQQTLTEVSVDRCNKNLSDCGLLHVSRCTLLREFRLFFQPKITAMRINSIKDSCKCLRGLNVFKFEGCACSEQWNCMCYM